MAYRCDADYTGIKAQLLPFPCLLRHQIFHLRQILLLFYILLILLYVIYNERRHLDPSYRLSSVFFVYCRHDDAVKCFFVDIFE